MSGDGDGEAAAPGWAARLTRPEAQEESDAGRIRPVAALPTRPWAFLWAAVSERSLPNYAAMILVAMLGQAVETWVPQGLKLLINAVSADTAQGVASPRSVLLFLAMVGAWFGSTMLFRVYQAIDIRTGPALRRRVQNRMFGYLLGHSPRYFQENFAGRLGQKIKESGRASLTILEMLCFDLARLITMLAVAIALLGRADPLMASLLFAWIVVYLAVTSTLARRCVTLSKAFSAAYSLSTGKLIDAITNADTVRAFAKWRHERAFLDRFFVGEQACSMRLRGFLTMMRCVQAVAVSAMLGTMMWLALTRTAARGLDIGTFAMVFSLTNLISLNVWNLSNRMLDFFEQLGTLTEAIDLVTASHEIVDRPGAPDLAPGPGAVRFDRVTFSHPDGTPLFRELSLDIAAGEKVALVGPSGAGKSTLVKLLRRHYQPQSGRVLIDGQDIAVVSWDSVNQAIAEVSQAPGVFHRPVRDNIRYGRLDAGQDAVERAAQQAHCHDFIIRRPEGYDTIVGEQGIKLSGGERQRVAIARALLKDSRILVLDEATSALDSESEHLIQQALFRLMKGRTVIAIAHRLSTITGMDRILYLEDGRIIETGSHAALLGRGGAYARLWNRQVGGFLAAE